MNTSIYLPILTSVLLVSCGDDDLVLDQKYQNDVAQVSCNIIRSTKLMNSASTIREVNNARSILNKPAYLEDDIYIQKAVLFDTCEDLVKDNIGWKEYIDASVDSAALTLLDIDLIEYHSVREDIPEWIMSELMESERGILREIVYGTFVETDGFEVESPMYSMVLQGINYCTGAISVVKLLEMSGDCPAGASDEIGRSTNGDVVEIAEKHTNLESETENDEVERVDIKERESAIEKELAEAKERERLLQEELVKVNERARDRERELADIQAKEEKRLKEIAEINESEERRSAALAEFIKNSVPLVAVAPLYPTDAARNGIEGWCLVELTVNALGNVVADSIVVIDREPTNIFDQSSIRAAARFKWQPFVYEGRGVAVEGVQYLFRYELD